MVKSELLDYVRASLERGQSASEVTRILRAHGWSGHDIDQAIRRVRRSPLPSVPDKAGHRTHHTPGGSGYHRRFFRLQERERIVFESRPLKGLLWYMLARSLIGLVIIGMLLLPFAFTVLTSGIPGLSALFFGPLLLFFLIFLVNAILVKRRYDMRYYWFTTNRVIAKRGLIGYSINSIPLERISDVLISRSFLERIFGFGSLHIQTLAGQYSARGKAGAEGNFEAIPGPEENQALIFKLVKQKRKDENLTM